MSLGLGWLGDANQAGNLARSAAVCLAALLDRSIAADAIAGFFHHGAFVPVVGFVTDPNVVHCTLDVLAIGGPGQGHVVYEARQPVRPRSRTGLRKALHQSLVGDANNAGIHRVVAMIVAILLAVEPQHIVESELGAQQCGHLARNHTCGAAGADEPEILRRNAREIPRVVERTRQKVLVFAQPAFITIGAKAEALAQGHACRTQQNAVIGPALCFKVGARCPGRAVALDSIGFSQGDGAVVQAVVQRLGERQDVFDLDTLTQQHGDADLHAAVGAAPIGCVGAEFFPQNPLLNVGGAYTRFGNAERLRNGAADTVIAFLVVGLLALRVLLLLAALLEIAREFNHDFCGPTITANERIDDGTYLIEPDMHRWVRNLAVALFFILGVVFGEGHVSL